MKEIRCDECKEVVMILAKGSKIKPNVYSLHEECPNKGSNDADNGVVSRDNSTYGAEDFARQMKSKDTFNDLFGAEIF